MHRRENPFCDRNHSGVCPRVSVNLPDETFPVVPSQKFPLPAAKARYPHLPNVRTTTRERGNDFQGRAVYTDGSSRLADGETLAGWGAVARSPYGRTDVMFGPLVTTEAHLAFAGASVHAKKPLKCRPLQKRSPFLGAMARCALLCFL